MKKIALTSVLAVFAVSAANAATNYFVGGSAEISTDNNHASVLYVAPELGWKLNSDWDLGVMAGFGVSHVAPKNDMYAYGAGAFARYKVAQFGGVKLLLKGGASVDFATISSDNDNIDGETLTSIGASITPMITYDISEAFTLYANLNFLGVYATYNFDNDKLNVAKSWSLGAGVDSENVANTSNFQIGFTYNF